MILRTRNAHAADAAANEMAQPIEMTADDARLGR
jgi:hypothetical protein